MKKTQSKLKSSSRNFSNYQLQTSPGGQSLTGNYLNQLKQSTQRIKSSSTISSQQNQKSSHDLQKNISSLSSLSQKINSQKQKDLNKSPQNSFLKTSSTQRTCSNKENFNSNSNYLKSFQSSKSKNTANYHSHQNSINPTISYFQSKSKRESLSGQRSDLGIPLTELQHKFQKPINDQHSISHQKLENAKQMSLALNPYYDKNSNFQTNSSYVQDNMCTLKSQTSTHTLEKAKYIVETQQSEPIVYKCAEHKDKDAEFQMWSGQQQRLIFYCYKCAVKLAQNGHQNIVEIPEAQESQISDNSFQQDYQQIKEQKLQTFLGYFHDNYEKWLNVQKNFNTKKREVQKYYHTQIHKADLYFQTLEQQIVNQRKLIKEHLLNQQSEIEELYQNKESEMNEYFEGIKGMKSDVEQNYQNIMTKVNIDLFMGIMKEYETKYEEVDDFFRNLQQQRIKVMKFQQNSTLSDHCIVSQLYEYNNVDTNLIKRSKTNITQSTTPQKLTTIHQEISAFKGDSSQIIHTCHDNLNSSPSHIQHTKPKQPQNSNKIYVSFEDKNRFYNAITQSRQRHDEEEYQQQQESQNSIQVSEAPNFMLQNPFSQIQFESSSDVHTSSNFGPHIQIENIHFSGTNESDISISQKDDRPSSISSLTQQYEPIQLQLSQNSNKNSIQELDKNQILQNGIVYNSQVESEPLDQLNNFFKQQDQRQQDKKVLENTQSNPFLREKGNKNDIQEFQPVMYQDDNNSECQQQISLMCYDEDFQNRQEEDSSPQGSNHYNNQSVNQDINQQEMDDYYSNMMPKKINRYGESSSDCGLFTEEFSKKRNHQKLLFLDEQIQQQDNVDDE